jgi:hypothetical protein
LGYLPKVIQALIFLLSNRVVSIEKHVTQKSSDGEIGMKGSLKSHGRKKKRILLTDVHKMIVHDVNECTISYLLCADLGRLYCFHFLYLHAHHNGEILGKVGLVFVREVTVRACCF